MARKYELSAEYDLNPDDEREVTVEDDPAAPVAPPTLDADERIEDGDDGVFVRDDDREEPVW